MTTIGGAPLKPPAPPIRHEIAAAIVEKVDVFSSFDSLPYLFVSIRGEVLPVKRYLVTVRSKRFAVFLARGLEGRPEVARIRHPRQRSIESRAQKLSLAHTACALFMRESVAALLGKPCGLRPPNIRSSSMRNTDRHRR